VKKVKESKVIVTKGEESRGQESRIRKDSKYLAKEMLRKE